MVAGFNYYDIHEPDIPMDLLWELNIGLKDDAHSSEWNLLDWDISQGFLAFPLCSPLYIQISVSSPGPEVSFQ